MNCLCCEKKLRGIVEDGDYLKWQRKYHKSCWKDRNINYNIYLKTLNLPNCTPTNLEYWKKKSCLD